MTETQKQRWQQALEDFDAMCVEFAQTLEQHLPPDVVTLLLAQQKNLTQAALDLQGLAAIYHQQPDTAVWSTINRIPC